MRLLLTCILYITLLLRGTLSIQFNVLNSGNVYQFSSDENTGENEEPLGTVACTEAGGAALTNDVTYSILEPGSVPFQLENDTGDLSLGNGEVLDYEKSQLHTFNVTCFYVADSSTSATATVRFSVLPVNEFTPVLSDSSLTVTISEVSSPGTILVSRDTSGLRQYTVSDADDGPDGEITFYSGDSNPPGFELNEDSGALSLVQPLDLDSGDTGLLRITYTILVCDGDRPRAECASLDVSILVRSANDNPPVFEQDVYTLTLPETTPIGTSLITVMCTDADRHGVGEFSGITVEPPNAPVYIPDQRNGTVILRESLDFEISNSVNVTLVCSDSGSSEANAKLIIIVIPENDHSPNFNITSYEFSIDRLTIIGREIGKVIAVDLDGNAITYTLSGSGSENFQLRRDGTLVLNDFVLVLEGSFFELTVTATDGKFNDSTVVRITVDGILSIPEIIIVVVCGLVFIVLVILFVVVFCCCFIGCYRCLPEKKRRTDSAEEMIGMHDQPDYFHPMLIPPPSMYDHGGPVYQMAQDPRQMTDEWHGSQDMLDTEEGEEEPDIALGSNHSSSHVQYTPSTLNEMVEIFHEGDNILDEKKKKKAKKQDKKQDKKNYKKQNN